ncbi:MAG: MFS transporter [Candidatus Heimdallarchaeota archaeon]
MYLFPAILLPTTIFILHGPKNQEMGDDIIKEATPLNKKTQDSENTCTVEGLSTKWIIAVCYFSIFALMFFFYLGPSQISYYVDDLELEISSFRVGIIMAAVMVAAALIGILYNQFKKILNFHIISLIGFGLLGIGFIILSFASNFAIFLVAALVGGFGFGFLLPNFSLYLVSNTSIKNRGKVVSGYNTMWYIGESLSPIIFQPIILATCYSAVFLIGSIGFFVL